MLEEIFQTEKHYRGKIKDKMSQKLKRLILAWLGLTSPCGCYKVNWSNLNLSSL